MYREKCPYCKKEIAEINHDDGYGYDEDVPHEQECEHCKKTFQFYTSISFYYSLHKADCLNDGHHQWKETTSVFYAGYFPGHREFRCKTCEEKREYQSRVSSTKCVKLNA